MRLSKKQNTKIKRGTATKALAGGFEFGAIAVAIAILVSVPVAVDPSTVLLTPDPGYNLPKFQVLMALSAVLLVTVLGFLILRRKALLGVPVLVPALAFLAVSALSALFSEGPWHSLFGDRNEGLLSLGAGVLLFYALARSLSSPLRVRVFLAAAVTTAVLVSLFGISQKYGVDMISGWRNPWYRDLGRPFSTVGNPITLASYLTLMIGAAVALCFKVGSSSVRYRLPWLFALTILGACWIYTDTRGALLGVLVALPIVLWLAQHRMETVRPLLIPLVTLVGAMAVALAASAAFGNLPPSTSDHVIALIVSARGLAVLVAYLAFICVFLWLSRRGTRTVVMFLVVSLAILVVTGIAVGAAVSSGNLALPERLTSNLTLDSNTQTRLYIWRDTVSMTLERPLLGHGPDNFRGPFEAYIGEDLKDALTNSEGEVLGVDRVHNDFLQIVATTGLLGLAAYIWVLVSYFRNVYRYGGWPLISLSGGVLAYIFAVQTAFPTIVTNVTFWGLLGTSVAIMRLQVQEEDREPETPSEAVSIKQALGAGRSKTRLVEPLVVIIVVTVLSAIAIPTFLSQRAETAELQQAKVKVNVTRIVSAYKEIKAQTTIYPMEGVYDRNRPVMHPIDNSLVFLPTSEVTITVDVTPEGEFTVEGESTMLTGTFRYSYDSATDTYVTSPS